MRTQEKHISERSPPRIMDPTKNLFLDSCWHCSLVAVVERTLKSDHYATTFSRSCPDDEPGRKASWRNNKIPLFWSTGSETKIKIKRTRNIGLKKNIPFIPISVSCTVFGDLTKNLNDKILCENLLNSEVFSKIISRKNFSWDFSYFSLNFSLRENKIYWIRKKCTKLFAFESSKVGEGSTWIILSSCFGCCFWRFCLLHWFFPPISMQTNCFFSFPVPWLLACSFDFSMFCSSCLGCCQSLFAYIDLFPCVCVYACDMEQNGNTEYETKQKINQKSKCSTHKQTETIRKISIGRGRQFPVAAWWSCCSVWMSASNQNTIDLLWSQRT